jgi:hypothetical protein
MRIRIGVALTASVLMMLSQRAYPHGIAGNRYFVGTLTFDDPAVADEAIVPFYTYLPQPAQGSNVVQNQIDWSFTRLLTPTLAITYDSGWMRQAWPIGQTSGFDSTDIGLKYEAYRNNQHEALVSIGAAFGIPHSGSQSVAEDAPTTIQPGIFFGKGFGDLPESLGWLRPFALTGAVVSETPIGPAGKALAQNLKTNRFVTVQNPAVETLNWGFSVQYSTYYLTSRFTGGPPKDEPLHQWVPLVELSFQSPIGQTTAATVSPGFAYVEQTWQVSAELVVPMNGAGGNGLGFRAQLLLFLDDLAPKLFGKPLLIDKPEVNQIAWR